MSPLIKHQLGLLALDIDGVKMSPHSIEQQLRSMLPQLSEADKSLIASLPEEYVLDVPHVFQEEKSWSGAAVVQMLYKFFNKESSSQKDIMYDAGWDNSDQFDHSTFREKLSRYFLKNGFLYSHYYPAEHIVPAVGDGIRAADILRKYAPIISQTDFAFFKALLFSRQAPLVARVHFSQDEYPMSDDLARRLDVSGHCVLIIGYDKNGFILNDPWDIKKWGGKFGGGNSKRTYEQLIYEKQFVNSSYNYVGTIDVPYVRILPVRESVYENKEITIQAEWIWKGVQSILNKEYSLHSINAELVVEQPLSIKNMLMSTSNLGPGETLQTSWRINAGPDEGSYAVSVDFKGVVSTPSINWEVNTEQINTEISAMAYNRVCVFKREFLENFGMRKK